MREVAAIRLRQLCREKGWSPNQLADESGVPRSTVKHIFDGASANPGIVTVKKLCDGLGITLPEFFDDPVFHGLEQEIR